MATDDAVSTTSHSPERTLSSLLKRTRIKKGVNDSNISLASNDMDHHERVGLFGTIDRGLDKLKARASVDGDRTSPIGSSSKLSKLIPKKIKRRKKEAQEREFAPDDDLGRGRSSVKGSGVVSTNSSLVVGPNNLSEESLGGNNSAGSSILTDGDSDLDGTLTKKPSLLSRTSHAGYLTFSSPLIAAETVAPSLASESFPSVPLPAHTSGLQTTLSPSDTISDTQAFHSLTRELTPAYQFNDPITTSSIERDSGLQETTAGKWFDNRSATVLTTPARTTDSTTSRTETFASVRRYPTSHQGTDGISDTFPPVTPQDVPRTPSTLVTPPSPVELQIPSPTRNRPKSSLGSLTKPAASASSRTAFASADSPSHRRVRSTTTASSKLSAFPLLSPTTEEAKTPGGSLTQPSGTGGFFSSVVSATQNAVNPISNFFSSSSAPSGQRSRSGTGLSELSDPAEEVVATNSNTIPATTGPSGNSEAAVATLGSGNLPLSYLGILENSSPMTSASDVNEQHGRTSSLSPKPTPMNQSEQISAAQAVSTAYAEKSAIDIVGGRPRSIGSVISGPPGRESPPSSLKDGTIGHRSGSVRSRISERTRKHRGSSSATGGAIAAALAATHAAAANPGRSTGLAIAGSKRNKDFHQLFKSIPEDDYLIEDYSAALQRDILHQGRFYVSEKHICFSSNILGWVTSLVIHFDEVVSMEKKNTAVIFPNAIVIQTLHAKNVFASFISRDPTYDLLINTWKIGHPNLKPSANGHVLEESNDGKAGRTGSMGTEDDDSDEDSDEFYDEDEDEEDGADSFVNEAASSMAGSEGGETTKVLSHKGSPPAGSMRDTNGASSKAVDVQDSAVGVGAGATDFPGPATHAPTECTDQDSHYDKQVMETTIQAPLGKVYSMMFGPASGTVMRKFLLDDQKSGDLQMEDDKKGMGDEVKTSTYSFIKPLSGAIGPKQTKCIVSQTLDTFDLEKAVSVTCSTQTPDVPSGSAFVTKTKYCLMWGPGNSTKLLMNCTVEWSGKSWLKGPIEKGANDGQTQYGKDIAAFLKSQVAAKSPTKGSKGKVKGKRKKSSAETSRENINSGDGSFNGQSRAKDGDWGLFEPLHGILGPVADIMGPLASVPAILGLLLLIVSILWMRSSYRTPSKNTITPQRLAAYEELWRREESQLWNWLEDRINMDELGRPIQHDSKKSVQYSRGHDIAQKLDEEKMSERQIDDAIKVTEERLGALKDVVARKRAHNRDSSGHADEKSGRA